MRIAAAMLWAALAGGQPAVPPATDNVEPAAALALGHETFLRAACDRATVQAAQGHFLRAKTSSDPAIKERAEFMLKMVRNALRSIRQGTCTVVP
ncbi:MAG: hypothetical protein ACOY5Y_10785 [Pseudomonadota bacterium]